MLLEGKVAIVTGGSRGIGRAISEDLAKNGAKIVVNYNSNADAANETVAAINALGSEAIAVQADVSDFDQAQALGKAAIEAYGQVDILVNNAGTTKDTLLMTMKEAQWDDVMDINLKSAFNMTKAVARPMIRKKNGGRIINISSVSGLIGLPGQSNYSASKAGMIGFSKALAKELGGRAITVNCIAPGFIPTDLTSVLDEDRVKWITESTPLGRMGKPEEIAHAVTFLASDHAAFITGETLRVDGGIAM